MLTEHDPKEEWNQLSVEQRRKKAVMAHSRQPHRQSIPISTSARHHADPSSTPAQLHEIIWTQSKYELLQL